MDILDNEVLREVLSAYGLDSRYTTIRPLGAGNINYTYLARTIEKKIVLQKINSAIFPQPALLAHNFLLVTNHISKRATVSGVQFQCPLLIPTKDGELSYDDSNGDVWRAQTFIEHIPLHDIKVSSELALGLGRTLGLFHLLTADLDVEDVVAPIPGFHFTPGYLLEFDRAVSLSEPYQMIARDDSLLFECLNRVESYRTGADTLERMRSEGRLRPRVIHGDPKLDNIIISPEGDAVGMFDLDTVGAGLIHYDIGDCLRSVCNKSGEKGDVSGAVDFNIGVFEAVLTGYFESAGECLTHDDVSAIYDSVRVVSLELGIRFLTDHLLGDIYFRVANRGDNLRKAHVQFRLVESIVAKEKQIRACIARLAY